jgi:hypothetical protein
MRDRQRRTGQAVATVDVSDTFERIENDLQEEAKAQAIAQRIKFLRPLGTNETTAAKQALGDFATEWKESGGPRTLVPGKLALARLNAWAQDEYQVSVTPGQLASEFEAD